jgi:predicted metalloprotease with PDZ domain
MELDVRITSRLEPRHTTWVSKHGASTITGVRFRDARGELKHALADVAHGGARFTLSRAPSGPLQVAYTVRGQPFAATRPLAPSLDHDRARFSGEAVFLLPETPDDALLPVRLTVDASAFPNASVASSLGLGSPLEANASAQALFRTSVLVGVLGVAELVAPEGVDRAAWLGYSSFDPRQVVAEIAGFRTGVRQALDARTSGPSMLLFASDSRRPGEFDVMRRAGGVLVHAGVSQSWDGPARIAVMQQMTREWIGSELSVAAVDGGFPLERAWFEDGVNRWFARDLLFRFGLLTPEEYRDDIEQVVRLQVTSPLATKPLHTLATESHDQAAMAVVTRGAMYALLLHGAIRKRSAGKHSLVSVLRTLLAKARQARVPLRPGDFVEAVRAELGDDALAYDADVLRGTKAPSIPIEALGPCFVSVKRRYERYSLGFHPSGSEEGAVTVTALDPAGPAARAGLREGDVIASLSHAPLRVDRDVVVLVEREGQELTLRYRPSAGSSVGQGFDRKPKLPDEQCRF